MKKVLFLCPRIPYPPIGGDRAKNYHLIKQLSHHFELTIYILSHEPLSQEAADYLNQHGKVILFKTNYYLFKFGILLSFFRLPKPIQVSTYYFSKAQQQINELIKSHDLVFANLIRMASYVMDASVPKICDMADSIAQNYKRSAQKVKSLGHKIYYLFESKLLVDYEQTIIDQFDIVTLFNQREIEAFGSKPNIKWIPHGVNEELFQYAVAQNREPAIAFFGKMDYRPNVDAVLWFIEHVLPLLPVNIKFYIVGAYPTSEIRRKENDQIIVTGFMDDPYTLLSSVSAVVAPMQTGGGIQNKVLEMMAIGQLNIISPIAALPMRDTTNGKEFIVADTPEEWAKAVINAVDNQENITTIGKQGRNYIKERFTWEIAGQTYAHYINEVLDK